MTKIGCHFVGQKRNKINHVSLIVQYSTHLRVWNTLVRWDKYDLVVSLKTKSMFKSQVLQMLYHIVQSLFTLKYTTRYQTNSRTTNDQQVIFLKGNIQVESAVNINLLSLTKTDSFKRLMVNCNDTITDPYTTIPAHCRPTQDVLHYNAICLCIARQAYAQPCVAPSNGDGAWL